MKNTLMEQYREWRELQAELQQDGHKVSTCCGETTVREDFSNFAELPYTIAFDEMLKLERAY